MVFNGNSNLFKKLVESSRSYYSLHNGSDYQLKGLPIKISFELRFDEKFQRSSEVVIPLGNTINHHVDQ